MKTSDALPLIALGGVILALCVALVATGHHRNGDLETASQKVDRAKQAEPRNPLVYLVMGLVAQQRGQSAGAQDALAQALGAQNSAPQITAQPVSVTVIPGQNASFSVSASGNPLPAYQWQLQTPGGTTWSNLTTTSTYSGPTTATLTVNSVTDAMSGNLFQCVISNANGTATTAPPAALIVTYPLYLSTMAGQAGSSGSTDGSGSIARFNDPSDVAADGAGNVFVADTNNHTIRKITPAGEVTTLAGLARSAGSANGTALSATFNCPTGIAFDLSGNLYITDTWNQLIWEIQPCTK